MRHSETKLLHSIFAGTLSCMGPLGRKLAGHLGNGNHAAIANCVQPDPASETFINDYAAYNFLRKYEDLDTGIDTYRASLSAWEETEVACQALNETWSGKNHGPLIHSASRKISEVLGEFCPDEFFSSVDHSGGASTQRGRSTASIDNKESDRHKVTLQAAPLLVALQRHMGYYATPAYQNFSKFATVPKDSKTDRPILIENQGNMHMQKAVGSMIRRRLRRVGVDLNDQSINQRRAGEKDIATIDLSSASDLIWSKLVLILLPGDWADIILRTRCPFVNVDGKVRELHKVGGMGNGFVFELESLLFWAISSAAIELSSDAGPLRDQRVTVYGDDIIVDASHAETVMGALSAFGFRINRNKSFWTGPFRESCGFHYHNGRLITPIYIKHFDFTFGAWYHLYNSLRILSARLAIDFDKQLHRIEHYLRSKGEWNLVPETFGLRAGIHATWDEAVPKAKRAPRGRKTPWFQGWIVRVNREASRDYTVCQLGSYLRTLRHNFYRQNNPPFGAPRHTYAGKYLVYDVVVSDLSGGYNNNRGDRRFNLRTGSRAGSEVFQDIEISHW